MNRSSERGQAMLEFVFAIPFVLVFVFAALEFGALFVQTQRVAAVSREAANAVYRDCGGFADDAAAEECADGVLEGLAAQTRSVIADFDERATVVATLYRADADGNPSLAGRSEAGGANFRPTLSEEDLDPALWQPGRVAVVSEAFYRWVGSSRVDLQACKLEYSIVSPK